MPLWHFYASFLLGNLCKPLNCRFLWCWLRRYLGLWQWLFVLELCFLLFHRLLFSKRLFLLLFFLFFCRLFLLGCYSKYLKDLLPCLFPLHSSLFQKLLYLLTSL